MQSKKLIFSSDDFGNNHEINMGILKGVQNGIISSTCIMPNGSAYQEAVNEILPQIPTVGMGVHLDIIENKSLLNKNSKSKLCSVDGRYNNSYPELIYKSSDNNFLEEVEAEFRSQIEAVLAATRVDHINSHVHTHAIPNIFELTCKLASEYKIGSIRTQYEYNYFIPQKSFNFHYPFNLVKVALLNNYSRKNKITARKYRLTTNDAFVGVRYTGFMDKDSVLAGLQSVKNIKKVHNVEVLIHPYFYLNPFDADKSRFGEYLLTEDMTIKEEITEMRFESAKFEDIRRARQEIPSGKD